MRQFYDYSAFDNAELLMSNSDHWPICTVDHVLADHAPVAVQRILQMHED